ncbi:hypothetical protein O9992_27045 [Vibrio lentus]|nr:hypothetical protein [Vibrio lentus]
MLTVLDKNRGSVNGARKSTSRRSKRTNNQIIFLSLRSNPLTRILSKNYGFKFDDKNRQQSLHPKNTKNTEQKNDTLGRAYQRSDFYSKAIKTLYFIITRAHIHTILCITLHRYR